jgi:putative restriction endonuclease
MTRDFQARTCAFEWLAEQTAMHGDVLEWRLLARGFDLDGVRVPLVSQQGIFKPAVCELPLSARTSADSPYDDHFVEDRLAYRYRGTDPDHPENAGLRRLMRERVPLVYFHAVVEGRYLASWPVLVVGDEREKLRFWIQAEAALEFGGAQLTGPLEGATITDESARRQYATRLIQGRLHQRGFRERVLRAYLEQCAMCRLRQRELLDAAHIKPDTAGGEPVVPNGLALCKIHHTAFDVGVLGVRPADLRIHVRRDILEEIDGPMLRHGLQGLNGERIKVPRSVANHPDPELLRWKWERFERVG